MEAEREVQGLGCTERGHWPGVRGRQRLDRGTESEAAADPPPPPAPSFGWLICKMETISPTSQGG